MNALDKIKEFVAATPDSTWWVEELLFRGEEHTDEHGGRLKGAHVRLGVRYNGPDGVPHLSITQPIPVGDLPNGIPVVSVLSELHLTQQNTIDTNAKTIENLSQKIEEQQKAHTRELDEVHQQHHEARAALIEEHKQQMLTIHERAAVAAAEKPRRHPR